MVFILGASSLSHALDKLSDKHREILQRYGHSYLAIPGLSINPYANRPEKQAHYYLNPVNGIYRNRSDIVLWHDLINNSLTRRPRTNDRVLSKSELVTEIKKFKNNINCLVYCQRKGAPDVNSHLKNSGILTLNIVRDLLSPRKQRDPVELAKYTLLHQAPRTEWKTFFTIRKHSGNLRRLIARKSSKKLKPARRKALMNRRLREQQ